MYKGNSPDILILDISSMDTLKIYRNTSSVVESTFLAQPRLGHDT